MMFVKMRGVAFYAGLATLVGVGAGLAISPAMAFQPDEEAEAAFIKHDGVAEKLKIKLSAKFRKRGQALKNRGALVAFYDERDYKPVWLTDGRLNERGVAVRRELANAAIYGLSPEDYQTPGPESLTANGHKADAGTLAQYELLLSRAALTYMHHANEGRFDQSALSRFLDRRGKPINATAKLAALAQSSNAAAFLASQHPDNPQFRALMKALVESKAPVQIGERIRVPRGPLLRPGAINAQVALVRRRLGVKAAEGANPKLYDDELKTAVVRFQKEHNLPAEGLVGLKTRFAMNAPRRDRRGQILANMERWRWMPRDFGETYVRVNIPQFKMWVIRNEKIVHEERVIVGKPGHKTPVFSAQMKTVVFNPYWNIPQSIIWNEMNGRIPAGFEGGVRNGRMWIRQPPGNKNALGRVKFLFPNKHSVYMHDTPAKSLFNRKRRAYSHGCMRLRNPDRLAEVVLGFDGWSNSKVQKQFRTLRNNQVQLKKPIPVHVQYFTLWADKDGNLASFSDIYGHDNRIYAAITRGVDYARAKFPEVRKQKVVASRDIIEDRRNGYDSLENWFFPTNNRSGAFWGAHSRKKVRRTRLYRKRKSSNPFKDFFSQF